MVKDGSGPIFNQEAGRSQSLNLSESSAPNSRPNSRARVTSLSGRVPRSRPNDLYPSMPALKGGARG